MSSTRAAAQVACVLGAVWCAVTVIAADRRPDAAPETIRIGLVEPAGSQATELFAGASAAVEQLNATGGVAGRPVNLVVLGSAQPWRDGAAQLARLAFGQRLSAMIGPTDGAAAHVAAQIATMKRIPIITLSPEEPVTLVRLSVKVSRTLTGTPSLCSIRRVTRRCLSMGISTRWA